MSYTHEVGRIGDYVYVTRREYRQAAGSSEHMQYLEKKKADNLQGGSLWSLKFHNSWSNQSGIDDFDELWKEVIDLHNQMATRIDELEQRLDQHESDDVVAQAMREYKTKNSKLRSDNTLKEERIKELENQLRECTKQLEQFKDLHKNIAGLIKT